ncbi:hypothetical protein CN984_10975 [Bacillus cereus]|uniref:Peptidase C39-like domain-containing protein n=1 Tax=Bacillus cereus TaxID=1396 RepID=A0A2B9Q2Y5_BACCE|nr:hypothetical protein [Bacillus cereus]PGO30042.1 hypothetical protein CN984_10975 [Bacillus cereus]
MKKGLQILFSMILAITLLFSFNFESSFAQNQDKEIDISSAQKIANEYLKKIGENADTPWSKGTLEQPKKLYDLDGNLTSYIFQVKVGEIDSGYMIVSAISEFPGVLESTREGKTPYENIKEGDAIYVGPLLHYGKEKNGNIKDLKSKKTLSKNSIKSKGPLDKHNIKNLAQKTKKQEEELQTIYPQAISNYTNKMINGVPDYTWYLGCAPTSGANIVQYWAEHGYSRLGPDSGNMLINHLAYEMKTNSTGGTTVNNMRLGMLNFWKMKGYNPSVTTYSGTFAKHKEEILAGRPSWLTTENHPVWTDHALTGVGVEEFYNDYTLQWYRNVIVHDTWDNTPKDYWIQWSSYFDFVISIRP